MATHRSGRRPIQFPIPEVHFLKARALWGDDEEPFEATYQLGPDGHAEWTWKPVEDPAEARILELAEMGETQREIAKEVGMSLGAVNSRIKAARPRGELLPA